jgi:hypothetical protein
MNTKHTYTVGAVIIVLCGWVVSAFGVEFIKEKVAKVDATAERVSIVEHDLTQHKVETERRWNAQSNATTEMKADIKLLLREVSEIGAHVQNLKTIDE